MPPEPSPAGANARKWSTPLDVRCLFLLVAIAAGWLFLHGFAEGVQVSAQFFPTRSERLLASAVWFLLLVILSLYLYWRKPHWLGWHGHKEKLDRPKLRHGLYALGALLYIWAPELPGILPTPPLEQAILLEIPTQIDAL